MMQKANSRTKKHPKGNQESPLRRGTGTGKGKGTEKGRERNKERKGEWAGNWKEKGMGEGWGNGMGEGNGMERDAVRERKLGRGWIWKGIVMGLGMGYDGIWEWGRE